MDQRNRKEYMKELEEKAAMYEKKFRHVVAAYKSLQSEKSALEVTLKSISEASSSSLCESTAPSSATGIQCHGPETKNTSINQDFTPTAQTVSAVPNIQQLKDTVATLTKALSTVTGEKSHMEASYIADKKKLNLEKDKLEKQLSEVQNKSSSSEKLLKEQIQKLKCQLRTQQHEHEKEQNNQQIMLRELQKRIADERLAKEHLENKMEEIQIENLSSTNQLKTDEENKEILELKALISEMSSNLQAAEERAKASSFLASKLQKDLMELKEQHKWNMRKEQERANEVERQLNNIAKISENRSAESEAKIAEFSQTIGAYDRQHQQDQTIIKKLKERISQLDLENSELAQGATGINTTFGLDKEMDDTDLDVEALIEKITKLHEMLHEAKKKSNMHAEYLNLYENPVAEANNTHYQCQLELQQLKDEFDQYKGRVQATFKNRRQDSNKEVEELKNQVEELKEKNKNLTADLAESEHNYMSTVTLLRSSLAEVKSIQQQELAALENEWKGKLMNLEQQLQKQRQRSLSLLEEKDSEIVCLKSRTNQQFLPLKKGYDSLKVSETEATEEVLSELSELTLTEAKEQHFLHYWHELARKDVEISNLRRSKHQLEGTIREIQLAFLSKEESLMNEVEELTCQVHRLKLNTSREGANLEYLKNVVLSYMLSSSSDSRQHMLNAIAAVLKFTSKELESVKVYNARWW